MKFSTDRMNCSDFGDPKLLVTFHLVPSSVQNFSFDHYFGLVPNTYYFVFIAKYSLTELLSMAVNS